MRDAAAPQMLAEWLVSQGFTANLTLLEALGGPQERIRQSTAEAFDLTDINPLNAVAIQITSGQGLPQSAGLDDALFRKRRSDHQTPPARADAFGACTPNGRTALDIGAGSGSISVEWCLAGGRALAFELRCDRAENIRANAATFGIDHRLTCLTGPATDALQAQTKPDAVFIGGGGNAALFDQLWNLLPAGTRIVANGVTLETEALLALQHSQRGGNLLRIDLAAATPLGSMRGWSASRPVVQWSVIR